jgi:hypothetical protein
VGSSRVTACRPREKDHTSGDPKLVCGLLVRAHEDALLIWDPASPNEQSDQASGDGGCAVAVPISVHLVTPVDSVGKQSAMMNPACSGFYAIYS